MWDEYIIEFLVHFHQIGLMAQYVRSNSPRSFNGLIDALPDWLARPAVIKLTGRLKVRAFLGPNSFCISLPYEVLSESGNVMN